MKHQALIILGIGLILFMLYFGDEMTPLIGETWNRIIDKYASVPPSGMTIDAFTSLIKAVIQHESGWNPSIVGITGDIGLMQINPTNAPKYNLTRDDLFDPDNNIRVGADILRWSINQYGIVDGLAAYNAGPNGRFLPVAHEYAQMVLKIYQNVV